jgi:hypothetical protein
MCMRTVLLTCTVNHTGPQFNGSSVLLMSAITMVNPVDVSVYIIMVNPGIAPRSAVFPALYKLGPDPFEVSSLLQTLGKRVVCFFASRRRSLVGDLTMLTSYFKMNRRSH